MALKDEAGHGGEKKSLLVQPSSISSKTVAGRGIFRCEILRRENISRWKTDGDVYDLRSSGRQFNEA